jgi:hypothetical protein
LYGRGTHHDMVGGVTQIFGLVQYTLWRAAGAGNA